MAPKDKFLYNLLNRSVRTFLNNISLFIGSASCILLPFLVFDALFLTKLSEKERQILLMPPDVVFVFDIILSIILFIAATLFIITVQLSIKSVVKDKAKEGSVKNIYIEAWNILPGFLLVHFLVLKKVISIIIKPKTPGLRNVLLYSLSGTAFIFEGKQGSEALELSADLLAGQIKKTFSFILKISALVVIVIYDFKWVLDKMVELLISFENLWLAKILDILLGFIVGLVFVFAFICVYYFFEYLSNDKNKPEIRSS